MPYMKLRRIFRCLLAWKKRNAKKLSQSEDNQTNTQNYEQKYFRLASVSFPSRVVVVEFGLFLQRKPIEKRVKSDSKIYKENESKTFKRQSIQSKSLVAFFSSLFFFLLLFHRSTTLDEKRQRTTFAAASLTWVLLCLRLLMPPEKTEPKETQKQTVTGASERTKQKM